MNSYVIPDEALKDLPAQLTEATAIPAKNQSEPD
jgi:hypothetical protein